MGSSLSKFTAKLQNGDEFGAFQSFKNSSELQRNLNPNSSYGDSMSNTPLHLAAKHAMKPLLKIFLEDLGGNPNKCNSENATALHLACQGQIERSLSTKERRTACVSLLLQWRGPNLENGENEEVNLSSKDMLGNTALHYAASTGLTRCVELLIRSSSPLFVENNNQETACDLAEKNGYKNIAEYLESKMVFSTYSSDNKSCDIVIQDIIENSGLRPQELLETKDHLLVETSDMLHIPLFTAEALLRSHEWSRESLLEAWMLDPVLCCQRARVQAPPSALQFSCPETTEALQLSCTRLQMEYERDSLNSPSRILPLKAETMCEICVGPLTGEKEPVVVPCGHQFCQSCWESYLSVKIQEGDAHSILCADFNCQQLIPIDIVEKIVSPNMVRRYLQFDLEAFVESNPNIKWCPFPGCSQAVKKPEPEGAEALANIPNLCKPEEVSHSIDCGKGHFFCWECLGPAHSPCGCARWIEWQSKIAEIKPEDLKSSCNQTEDAANCLWLVTNSKPCPNCKSPIQKNEGCNHMKCSKCKHDFCWVCLETWKRHSSSTGGYFRCNRFDSVRKAEEKMGELICEAEARNLELQEIKRFVHYYTRYKNHENSYKLEEPLILVSREKMKALTTTLTKLETPILETHFLEDAINELLRARKVLCGSYVYGYFLEDHGYNKTIFEFMQNDLEDATEFLSEMVTRHYLQSPKAKIIESAFLVKRKRQEFVTSVDKGLIPPETPPSLRKSRKRQFPSLLGMDELEDEEMARAIMASLIEIDKNDPWIKDSQGKHTNAALYDWPQDEESEDEASSTPTKVLSSILGTCSRQGCSKPKARNPRTLTVHEYCSLRCNQIDKDSEPALSKEVYEVDYSMDLLIALEMSQLQMIEDNRRMEKRSCSTKENSVTIPNHITEGSNNTENSISNVSPLFQWTNQNIIRNKAKALEDYSDFPLGVDDLIEQNGDEIFDQPSTSSSNLAFFLKHCNNKDNWNDTKDKNLNTRDLEKTKKDLFSLEDISEDSD